MKPTILEDFQLCQAPAGVDHPSGLTSLDPPPAWCAAPVPGTVQQALVDAGQLPHPFVAGNEAAARWPGERTWWYRTTLTLPADVAARRARLEIGCLDTVADVWLDDTLLGSSANQFVPFVADLPAWAADGRPHTLAIRISPPLAGLSEPPRIRAMVDAVAAALAEGMGSDEHDEPSGILNLDLAATRRRKAMLSWGWDFAPRCPSVGIGGPVQVLEVPDVELGGVHVATTALDLAAATATLCVTVELRRGEASVDAVEVTVTSPAGRHHVLRLPVVGDATTVRGDLHLADVQPWWTHDLGEPSLYDVHVAAVTAAGDEVATHDLRTGVRTIALDRSPDTGEDAHHFAFVLNGVRVFARGANWVPPSMLVESVADTVRERLVALARRGNMTMLRVWGGGTYETDAFYDACDREGVLVWQDAMFACIDYPEDDAQFMAEVRRELTHQVRRLRNHPCLAVWAGNNEVLAMHQAVHRSVEPGPWGHGIFFEVLPRTIAEEAPGSLYWAGCPWTDMDVDPRVNGTRAGDRHAWEVWHGADVGAGTHEQYGSRAEAMHFRRYRYDTGRFISEFGIHASDDLGTLRRWLGNEHLDLADPVFQARDKDTPHAKGAEVIRLETGAPTSLLDQVTCSQVLQAEGLKFGIEHYRRRAPHCHGTLVWQFNEPWPGMTWSLLDFDLGAKPGYHTVRRSFAPVLASFRVADDALELWVSNSGRTTVSGTARVSLADFTSASPDLVDRVQFAVDADDSAMVWRREQAASLCDAAHYAWADSPDEAFAPNRMFFGHIRELALPASELSVHTEATGATSARVTLAASAFTYFVRITTPWAGVEASDDAIDLRPGDTATVDLRGLPEGFRPDEVEVFHFTQVHGAPGGPAAPAR